MPVMRLKVPGLYVPVDHLLKIKKEYQNLNKPEIWNIFIKTIDRNLVFNMTWHMAILKVYQKERLLIAYHVINHLILPKTQNIMDIKEVYL